MQNSHCLLGLVFFVFPFNTDTKSSLGCSAVSSDDFMRTECDISVSRLLPIHLGSQCWYQKNCLKKESFSIWTFGFSKKKSQIGIKRFRVQKNLGISIGAKEWMTRRKKEQTKTSWISISMMSLSVLFFLLVLKTLMPWTKLYLPGVTHPLLSGHHWVQGETALTLCDLDSIRLVSLIGASEYQNRIS